MNAPLKKDFFPNIQNWVILQSQTNAAVYATLLLLPLFIHFSVSLAFDDGKPLLTRIAGPWTALIIFYVWLLFFRLFVKRINKRRIWGRSRFNKLANFYESIKGIAINNIHCIEQTHDLILIESFPIELSEHLYSFEEKGEKFSYIFAENIGNKIDFDLTQRILDFHGQILFFNGILQSSKTPSTETLKLLGDILFIALGLENIFRFIDKKSKIDRNDKNYDEKCLKEFYKMKKSINTQLAEIIQSNYIETAIVGRESRLNNYMWLTYNVTKDEKARMINHYFLPGEFSVLYLQAAAEKQANAMRRT